MDDDSLLFTLVVVICLFLIIYLYKRLNPTVITYLVTPQVIPQVIRIPVEDRVDLALDDKHNVHNKTLKRTAVHVIHQLNNCDQHHYTIKSALDDILELIRGDVVPPSPQRGASPPFRPPPFREGDLEGRSLTSTLFLRGGQKRISRPPP